ncbi:50S ribosomal protein L35 [Candidatus Vidania fulgoroideae]|uniref:50S ribosomal protein L35 n=1 Tax=Candidatus Vidania fulgoroideorum TaxID=881286 RepID=A0A974X7B3_9PROT|nr:50S ribosomal protein L35 [Candidatus Vidania fulgoroideae]
MIRTKRGFYKRLRVVKGKIKIMHSNRKHLLTKKSSKRKRRLKGNIYIKCQE